MVVLADRLWQLGVGFLRPTISDGFARFAPLLLRHLLYPEQIEVLCPHICPASAVSPLVDFLSALLRISADMSEMRR